MRQLSLFFTGLLFIWATLLEASDLDRVLLRFAREGNLEEVKRLIAAGADKNARVKREDLGYITRAHVALPDLVSRTPLMLAAGRNHVDVVEYLLESGADPKLTDDMDNTAHFYAFYFRSVESLKRLCKYTRGNSRFRIDGDNIYEGGTNEDGLPHCWGTLYKPSTGTSFEGGFQSGEQTGFGTLTYNDGGTWRGSFINGLAYGKVERTWPNGDRFTGHLEGRGMGFLAKDAVYVYADGSILKGQKAAKQATLKQSETPIVIIAKMADSSNTVSDSDDLVIAGALAFGSVMLFKGVSKVLRDAATAGASSHREGRGRELLAAPQTNDAKEAQEPVTQQSETISLEGRVYCRGMYYKREKIDIYYYNLGWTKEGSITTDAKGVFVFLTKHLSGSAERRFRFFGNCGEFTLGTSRSLRGVEIKLR